MQSNSGIHQTTHLITIPHPLHPYFLISILHLHDSLFVWCGETSRSAAEEASRRQGQDDTAAAATLPPPPLREHGGTTGSEEEQAAAARQEQVDREMEEELNKALAAAGRSAGDGATQTDSDPSSASEIPKGLLAREWAASMYNATTSHPPTAMGTSLFRTPSDIALPMSRRLAKRLAVPQVHLSLSLPQDLFPSQGNMPAPPGANQALLAVEKGIEESIQAGRASLLHGQS